MNRKRKKATDKKPIAYFYTFTHNKFSRKFYQSEKEVAADDPVGDVYSVFRDNEPVPLVPKYVV